MTRKVIKRKQNKWIFSCFCVLLSLTFVMFAIIFIPQIKSKKYFEKKEFFLVYAKKGTKSGTIESFQNDIKTLGGAGTIVSQNGIFYLVVCAYNSKEDAEEIALNLKNSYADAGVLKISREKFSILYQNKIRKNQNCFEFLKFLQDFVYEMIDLQFEYLAGELSQANFCKFLIKSRLEFGEYQETIQLDEDETLKNTFLETAELAIALINNFLNSFYESSKKSSLVLDLCLNFVLIFVDMS